MSGSRFVEVPAHAIRSRLLAAGFALLPGDHEEVYELRHARHPDFAVKVYTSLSRGATGARGCGEDAIRVCVVRYFHGTRMQDGNGGFAWACQAHGVADFPRVYRTGSVEAVLERMIDRAREAHQLINDTLKKAREVTA